MKLLLVLSLFAFVAYTTNAAPQKSSQDAETIEYNVDNIGIGGYSFNYKTSDGVERSEEATVINPGTENESLSVRGKISWVGPDGITYTIEFVADQNGFQPQGSHLPK